MVATVSLIGTRSSKITAITLLAEASETIAHGLPTTPELVCAMVKGAAANTSLQGTIAVSAVGATYVAFTNTGAQTLSGEACCVALHTMIQ